MVEAAPLATSERGAEGDDRKFGAIPMTMMKATLSLLALSACSAGFALMLTRLKQSSQGTRRLPDEDDASNSLGSADTLPPTAYELEDGVDVDFEDDERELPLDSPPNALSFYREESYERPAPAYPDVAPDPAFADETDLSSRPTDPMIDLPALKRADRASTSPIPDVFDPWETSELDSRRDNR